MGWRWGEGGAKMPIVWALPLSPCYISVCQKQGVSGRTSAFVA